MTTNYEYYSKEGDNASSAIVTREAETRILSFNPEKRLRELDQKRGKISLQAFDLELAA